MSIVDTCLENTPTEHVQFASISASGRHSVLIHSHLNGYATIQDISYALSNGHHSYAYSRRRAKYNSVWTEWEHDNPPMIADVEYKTILHHQGASIYAKVVSLGALPNNSEKVVICDLRVIGIDAYAVSGGYGYTIPLDRGGYKISCHFQNGSIIVSTNYDCSVYYGYATVYYVKTLW